MIHGLGHGELLLLELQRAVEVAGDGMDVGLVAQAHGLDGAEKAQALVVKDGALL